MKKYTISLFLLLIVITFFFTSCEKDEVENSIESCTSDLVFDQSRGECIYSLSISPSFTMLISGSDRIITSNCIPNHMVGLFGQGPGSLNPNTISEQNETYYISMNPTISQELIPLLNLSGANSGPEYSFGILLNGVELDPVAAEPFPHSGNLNNQNNNWEWNKEALNVNLGLDCNNAHVQPNGKYHYHAIPTLYLQNNIFNNEMTLVGYAADGFPIYYMYAYSDANNITSTIEVMTSSYKLKSGSRPGDGISSPCDEYNGVYTNDYEYIVGSGTLDEANGREGVTPEYPQGTYYYVLTDEFPGIPRYFKGTPSNDFRIGN
tara:strand:+ start:67 stop:1029 length:963 start_codon:yes stop_codon:yes gene_type:complete